MIGQESINRNFQNQVGDQNSQSFEVGNEQNLPVYNPLLGGFQPAQNPYENFEQQFCLPSPVIPPKTFDSHIFLPNYTHKDLTHRSLNIFNPEAGFYKKKELQVKTVKVNKSKVVESPHYYSVIDGTYVKKKQNNEAFANLKPVPIVNLDKKEESYTKTINSVLSYSPSSQGVFKATDSMLGLVIGFILFFLYLRTIFGKQIKLFYSSAFNRVRAVNVFEERGIITGRVSFILNIFYFLVLGLLGMHIMDYTGIIIRGVNPLGLFFILTSLFLSLYILKYLVGRILGHLLKFNDHTLAYFFHTFIFNKTYALFIFPLLLVIPYINNEWALLVLKGSLILYGVIYILRTFRILILSVQINVSIFYLFLYLCALEIVPILVIVKLASEWLQLPVF
jgi:hypothetical protein